MKLTRRQKRQVRKQNKNTGGFADLADIAIRRERRYRQQEGALVEYKDGVYLRYYKDHPITGERVRVSERLCDLDANSQQRERARRARMKAINSDDRHSVSVAQGEAEDQSLTISDYWLGHYKPFVDSGRWSTARGAVKLWDQYCEDNPGKLSLRNFETNDATQFLTKLVHKGLNVSSVARVKSVVNGLFEHAHVYKFTDSNPWRGAKSLGKPKATVEKIGYTPEERDAIIGVIKRLDAKLFFALCSVLRMRPSESACVRWENIDFDASTLRVKEAAA
jgi:hypothetical protein